MEDMAPTLCEKCGQPLSLGEFPFCPHGFGRGTAIGDEIPGGQWQENGFPHPRKFYSKRELKAALDARGLEMKVRHVPVPGTDKSPHTTDWSRGTVDLDAAAALLDPARRERSTTASHDVMADVPITWTIRERTDA